MNHNFYATVFNVFMSARDCKISFIDVDPVIGENGQVIDQKTSGQQTITLPLSTAKELVKILGEQITLYENQFGEIKTFLSQENPEEK